VAEPKIDIRAMDLERVQQILRDVLPPDSSVWVFGSRAGNAPHRGSDLDLAVDAGRPLSRGEDNALAFAFEESDLPYKVDVVDLHRTSQSFKAIIDQSKTPLYGWSGAENPAA
jgi:predicted nucleotidyltransferase